MSTKTRNPGMARPAAADMSGQQYHFGFINGDDKIALATSGKVGFPMQNTGLEGRDVTIEISGMSKCKLGGTVVNEDYLKTDAQGRGIKALPGDAYCGRAIMGGVSGDIITFFIDHGRLPAA